MKCSTYSSILFFALTVIFFAGVTCVSAEKKIETPDGYILLQDDSWQKLMEDPAHKFQKAWDSLLINNTQNAALYIRQAATIVNIEVTRAQKEMHKELQSISQELIVLSKKVKDGKVTTTSGLEKTFSKTEKVLARHKLKKAELYLSLVHFPNCAYALEAAARHILYSQTWSEQKLSDESVMKLKGIQNEMLTMIDSETYAKKRLVAVKKDLEFFTPGL